MCSSAPPMRLCACVPCAFHGTHVGSEWSSATRMNPPPRAVLPAGDLPAHRATPHPGASAAPQALVPPGLRPHPHRAPLAAGSGRWGFTPVVQSNAMRPQTVQGQLPTLVDARHFTLRPQNKEENTGFFFGFLWVF